MLFRKDAWPGLRDGSITVAVRQWRRPTVRAGGTLRSPVGLLAIDRVDVVEPADLTEADAHRAGFGSLAALLDDVKVPARSRFGPPAPGERSLYRVEFHLLGDDPRDALRESTGGVDEVRARLDRMDGDEPWTRDYLRTIAASPGVRAPDLAAGYGVETIVFKRRVRRLKELGLTESLPVGYRLSPRGRSALGLGDIPEL